MTLAKPRSTTWALDPQTSAKHEILRRYLGGWFGVMGHSSKRILFFDAFAGPGEYSDGSPGSPMIALGTLMNHKVVEKSCEFTLLFNEGDKERYEHLVELLSQAEATNPTPKNVTILAFNEDFTEITEEIASLFEDGESSLAPTLMFVDPFGISEAPLVNLQKILQFPKCEVFAYLSVNTLNRFGTAGIVDESMAALFGTDDFKKAPPAKDPNRIPYFVELYEKQLKSKCGFKYTRSFQMRNSSGIIIYSLVFATNNTTGLSLMKDAMWSVAPDGSYSFSARFSNQDILLEVAVDYEALGEAISQKFLSKEVSISTVTDYVLIETPYRASDVKKSLKILENLGKLTARRVLNPTSRRRGTYPDDSMIRFI